LWTSVVSLKLWTCRLADFTSTPVCWQSFCSIWSTRGELLFGKHADLKIEMRAPFRPGEPCDSESFYKGNQVEIHGAPDSNQNRVEHEKFYVADEFYNGITVALGARAAIQGFLFELGNGGNIELRGIFGDLVRHGFFHARSSQSSRIDIHKRDWQATEYLKIYGRLTALVCAGASVSAR
jgi:hypothetical protein